MGIFVSIIIVVVLVGFSAICSGLNIAVMSLDMDDLRRKAALGNANAKRLLPMRANAHLTLAAILLANVAVISATSLVLEKEFNGWIAGIVSTLLIVVFGEVLPQALFARNALRYTGRLAPLLKLMVWTTYPISKPLEIILDKMLGSEMQHLESRSELGIMIAEHANTKSSELDEDEIEIMQGALSLSNKRVRDIMVPIKKVYWLKPRSVIDAAKIDEIKSKGYSRIPILNGSLTASYGILLMKDLVDINFDEVSIKVEELNLYPSQMVGSMTALDTLFRIFISGGTHLLPVERDDKVVGIVTIEDLLEEIVGHEIVDETDRARHRS